MKEKKQLLSWIIHTTDLDTKYRFHIFASSYGFASVNPPSCFHRYRRNCCRAANTAVAVVAGTTATVVTGTGESVAAGSHVSLSPTKVELRVAL